jgi:hypothetical protein
MAFHVVFPPANEIALTIKLLCVKDNYFIIDVSSLCTALFPDPG